MITIRAARVEDIPEMDRIFMDAGTAAWPHILPETVLKGRKFPVRWTEAVSAVPPTAVLVAELNGKVGAFAVILPSPDRDAKGEFVAELDSFYSDPALWGKGIGRELLAAVHEKMRFMGYSRATLWTAELNHRPRKIYEKAGWLLQQARRERQLGGVEFVELRYGREL